MKTGNDEVLAYGHQMTNDGLMDAWIVGWPLRRGRSRRAIGTQRVGHRGGNICRAEPGFFKKTNLRNEPKLKK